MERVILTDIELQSPRVPNTTRYIKIVILVHTSEDQIIEYDSPIGSDLRNAFRVEGFRVESIEGNDITQKLMDRFPDTYEEIIVGLGI